MSETAYNLTLNEEEVDLNCTKNFLKDCNVNINEILYDSCDDDYPVEQLDENSDDKSEEQNTDDIKNLATTTRRNRLVSYLSFHCIIDRILIKLK